MPADYQEQLAAAANQCREALRQEPLSKIVDDLGKDGTPAGAFELLSQLTANPASGAEARRLCEAISHSAAAERALLVLASQHAIGLTPDLPVSDSVKGMFAEEFRSYAEPPAAWADYFRIDNVRFGEMARIATLRRFPAGQYHWELAAFPKSWVAKADSKTAVLTFVFGRMKGFGPVFELHLNDRRKNRRTLLDREANLSYYRAARSMQKQPAARAVMTASWLYSEATAKVTPRLAWLRDSVLQGGARIFDLGPAAADSGFLTGSEERRQLYEQGMYRPTVACVLWARRELLAWADRHREFEE